MTSPRHPTRLAVLPVDLPGALWGDAFSPDGRILAAASASGLAGQGGDAEGTGRAGHVPHGDPIMAGHAGEDVPVRGEHEVALPYAE